MTTGVLATPPILPFFFNNGQLAVNGSILTQVGGVNAATYSDSGLTTPLPNPIPLNSRGEISDANGNSKQLFLPPNTVYTFTLFDGPNGTGNQIWQATYVNGIQITGEATAPLLAPVVDTPILASLVRTAAEIAAGVTPTNFAYAPGWAPRYGVKGDGVTDDTSALQSWLNQAQQSGGAMPYLPPGYTCKTTAGLTYTGNIGIWMDPTSYIAPSGIGYVGLLITAPLYGRFRVRVEGAANALTAGCYLLNPKASNFEHITVNNFAGLGLVVDHAWDCVFENVVVKLCGSSGTTNVTAINASAGTIDNYAFSMIDGGSTCNEDHILRLQVEQANAKAIYVSPNTLSTVVDKIHSEQATPSAGIVTWQIGGNRCQYNTVRLNSNAPSANALARVVGARWTVINMLAEGSIVVEGNATGGDGTLIGMEIQGSFGQQVGQTGRIRVFGGGAAAYASVTDGAVRFFDAIGPNSFNSGGPVDVTYFGRAVNQQTASYQLVLEDSRKMVQMAVAGAGTLTIPANAAVAFPVGTIIEGNNIGGGNLTIAITTDTLQWVPSGSTGSRTVAVNGDFKLRKIAATAWTIQGFGIT